MSRASAETRARGSSGEVRGRAELSADRRAARNDHRGGAQGAVSTQETSAVVCRIQLEGGTMNDKNDWEELFERHLRGELDEAETERLV